MSNDGLKSPARGDDPLVEEPYIMRRGKWQASVTILLLFFAHNATCVWHSRRHTHTHTHTRPTAARHFLLRMRRLQLLHPVPKCRARLAFNVQVRVQRTQRELYF